MPTHFIPDRNILKAGRDGVRLTRWIAPEDSICLQVKCMEVVKSSDWPGVFCTLRRVTWALVFAPSARRGFLSFLPSFLPCAFREQLATSRQHTAQHVDFVFHFSDSSVMMVVFIILTFCHSGTCRLDNTISRVFSFRLEGRKSSVLRAATEWC